MGLFLFRFWPVLIPLLIYLVWWYVVGKREIKAGRPRPHFRNGPWYWIVLSSLLIAAGCFAFWGVVASSGGKGEYIPPHLENGKLVPGRVKPSLP